MAWDGEGSESENEIPQKYMLFGNSDGLSIQAEQLATLDCLDLITRGATGPHVVNFGFAFNYDVNQILWELSSRQMIFLLRHNRMKYRGFDLEYVPSKWLQVKRHGKYSKAVKIYDVWHFFNCALVTDDPKNPGALDKFDIGTPEEREYLARMKKERPQFRWEEIEEVKEYWTTEGRLMVALMSRVRDIFADAGFFINTWHGPGALARYRLNAMKIKTVDYRESNRAVWNAACYAFSAGRFEQFRAGLHIGDVWNFDINSAFPYAIQFLPNLDTGHWIHSRNVNRDRIHHGRFALYQINYKGNRKDKGPHPLFRRLINDNICWPDEVNGWYWSPEAELVKDDPNAEFIESWEYIDDGTRPMAWIAEMFEQRLRLKNAGDPMEYPIKLGMNSIYGQFAQRAGWENQSVPGPPRFHQIEWAGYITSMCKSMVYPAAKWAWEHNSLITIDTDGIFSTLRIPDEYLRNSIGKGLGQWEMKRHDGILLWQSGFYWIKDGEDWSKCRSRGAPRGTVPIEHAWEGLEKLESHTEHTVDIHYEKKLFVAFGLARQWGRFDLWRSWTMRPTELRFGGNGKRQHFVRACGKCIHARYPWAQHIKLRGWDEQLHVLTPMPPGIAKSYRVQRDGLPHPGYWSMKHRLPWEEKMKPEEVIDEEDIEPEVLIWEDNAL